LGNSLLAGTIKKNEDVRSDLKKQPDKWPSP